MTLCFFKKACQLKKSGLLEKPRVKVENVRISNEEGVSGDQLDRSEPQVNTGDLGIGDELAAAFGECFKSL